MNQRVSCSEMILRLGDLVDRSLSPAELAEEHPLECVECADQYRFETSLVEAVRHRLSRIAATYQLRSYRGPVLSRPMGSSCFSRP